MTDALGWRLKLGVVTPSVNTVVQPEYDDMRPRGVTNHIARIHIPDWVVNNDEDFDGLVRDIDRNVDDAVGSVLTCDPACVVLGVSIEAVYGDPKAGEAIRDRLRAKFGEDLQLIHAGDAIPSALRAVGVDEGPISLITPYQPSSEPHLRSFVESRGYELHTAVHLRSPTAVQIAHTSGETLRRELKRLAADRPRAIVQFGANMCMGRIAAEAEQWLDLPVISVNTATYWYALRSNGIDDQAEGFGQLLAHH
ncbi:MULTISPECIES: IgiC [Parafrankia]|uniref:IgiC n=1 Tax=Parafrankia soli TaxID=2599596 RepID=A0A1S1PGA8_9ACTN|nr:MULTISPECIES: IgiC [Parafrankia]ABW13113.1 IgiC, putative [Frankia sp. EAN1pec]OHV20179.1 IgiC [Parafrankia soli]TCJ33710.1 IgiC [Parafrankia sp. BMG5.11]CAI7974615.1 maleate isomerase [Frankia sp. Hr75.2]